MIYSDDLSVRAAREAYFKNSGFDESTYTDRWVKLPILGKTIYLPNVKPRRDAVPLHDIDHVLTEYKTDWLGEWQISSYELGTGCGRYWAGWLINMQAILAGAFRAPKECIKAFARGRKSKGVYSFRSAEPLLNERLGDLRKRTTAPADIAAHFSDAVLFYLVVLTSVVVHLFPLALLVVIAGKAL